MGIDKNKTKLLVLTSNLGGYSLAELPNMSAWMLTMKHWMADPNTGCRAVLLDISERYLDHLLPHEKSNFSVVLFNAESKALPKALADELSGKGRAGKKTCDAIFS